MPRRKPDAAFAERVKALGPEAIAYARRQGLTPEEYQRTLDERASEHRRNERRQQLPFPLPDEWANPEDPHRAREGLTAVSGYRGLLRYYGPDSRQDVSQFKHATDLALGIRLSWSTDYNGQLPEVPLAKDVKHPADEDWARLEQWFLTAAHAVDEGPKKPDPHAPYYPPKYYTKLGMSDDRLRKARIAGTLHAINPPDSPKRWHYSEPDAMRLWPECFANRHKSLYENC